MLSPRSVLLSILWLPSLTAPKHVSPHLIRRLRCNYFCSFIANASVTTCYTCHLPVNNTSRKGRDFSCERRYIVDVPFWFGWPCLGHYVAHLRSVNDGAGTKDRDAGSLLDGPLIGRR